MCIGVNITCIHTYFDTKINYYKRRLFTYWVTLFTTAENIPSLKSWRWCINARKIFKCVSAPDWNNFDQSYSCTLIVQLLSGSAYSDLFFLGSLFKYFRKRSKAVEKNYKFDDSWYIENKFLHIW